MSKPSWKDAPEWAQYLSQDYSGVWVWFKHKPQPHLMAGIWLTTGAAQGAGVKTDRNECWAKTLEQRPGVTQAVDALRQPETSDGSTASYYELPKDATELQHLISHRDMNAQIGEIFRACYRYGLVSHSPKIRDIKKIIFYAQAELRRLQDLEQQS